MTHELQHELEAAYRALDIALSMYTFNPRDHTATLEFVAGYIGCFRGEEADILYEANQRRLERIKEQSK